MKSNHINVTSKWCRRNAHIIILGINMSYGLSKLSQEIPDLYNNSRLKKLVSAAHSFNNNFDMSDLPAPRKGAHQ